MTVMKNIHKRTSVSRTISQRQGFKPILVIAHDAGGAEIIAAYLRESGEIKRFRVYAGGPAVKIFRREKIPALSISDNRPKIAQIIAMHTDAAFVLLGSGWMTKIESRALSESKKLGLKTVVYLESWSNFRERFGYPLEGWQECLPSEIWVGDRPALAMAKKYFPKTKVRFVRNQYFAHIRERFREGKRQALRSTLFLSDAVPGMEKVFGEFLACLPLRKTPHHILLRFHPADDRARYDALIEKYKKTAVIKKSKEKDIVRDFLSARVVIGTETVAMVLSVLCGIRTISIALLGIRKAPLPFKEIIRVRNAKSAARLI